MTPEQRDDILNKAQKFFIDEIVSAHEKNIRQLWNPKKFKANPFLVRYLARVAFGDDSYGNIAKALVYPRALGTSINTTFGNKMQQFCTDVLGGFASVIPGLDIEFEDQVDKRRKYCQIKAGPNTINKDDIKTIKDHFVAIKRLAQTNHNCDINPARDCVVGVLYGSSEDLSGSYKAIMTDYPVYSGREFWYRLTGDEGFYEKLIERMAQVTNSVDFSGLLQAQIDKLADMLRKGGEI